MLQKTNSNFTSQNITGDKRWNTCTDANSSLALPSTYSLEIHVFLTVVYGLLIVKAMLLNISVIVFSFKNKIKLSTFKILLINLAVSDTLSAIGIIPYISVSSATLRNVSRPMANFICTITEGQFLFWLSNSSAIFTITVIAATRYLVILYPLKNVTVYLKDPQIGRRCVFGIWTVVISTNVPNLVSRQYDPCKAYCKRVWPPHFSGRAFVVMTSFIGFVMPLLLMLVAYFGALRTFKAHLKAPAKGFNSLRYFQRSLRTMRNLIMVFILCWIPFTMYWFMAYNTNYFSGGWKGHIEKTRVIYIVLIFSTLNLVMDPIIYRSIFARKKERMNSHFIESDFRETKTRIELVETST